MWSYYRLEDTNSTSYLHSRILRTIITGLAHAITAVVSTVSPRTSITIEGTSMSLITIKLVEDKMSAVGKIDGEDDRTPWEEEMIGGSMKGATAMVIV